MEIIKKSINDEIIQSKIFLKKEKFLVQQKSDYPINDSAIELSKDKKENFIRFNLKLNNLVQPNNTTFKKLGFDDSFKAISEKSIYIIPSKSICNIKSKTFVETKNISGKLNEIYNSCFSINTISTFKAIYKITKDHVTTFCLGSNYICDKSEYALGLIKLKIENINYHLYRYSYKNNNYLIIECLDKIGLKTFKNDINLTLKSIAFLTGNWYQNERFIFSYNSTNQKNKYGIYYESLDKSIITDTEIINPQEFRSFMNNSFNNNYKLTSTLFPEKYLSSIINNAKSNPEYERTIDLLIECKGITSPIIKCSINFVALEAIVGLIHKQNKDFFKPIKADKKTKNIINDLNDLIDKNTYKFSENELNIIKKKILHLNTPTNKDIFLLSYDFYNIDLPKRLEEVLSTRNKFLHGKTPFDETNLKLKVKELNRYAERAHLLVSILILKYSGYKGHVKNYATFRLISEEYYSEIQIQEDIGQNDNVFYKI